MVLTTLPAANAPPKCQTLLVPTWTVEAVVEKVMGMAVEVRTPTGCGITLEYESLYGKVKVGDLVRITGGLVGNMVVIDEVEKVSLKEHTL